MNRGNDDATKHKIHWR